MAGVPRALEVVHSRLERLTLPSGHREIEPTEKEHEFGDAFAIFNRCLTDPNYVPRATSEINEEEADELLPIGGIERLQAFVTNIAVKEKKILGGGKCYPHGRPGAKTGSDPYESYLRTYILGGANTHSDAYNAIFKAARDTLIAKHPDTGLDEHRLLWERWHPVESGEAYYPQAYVNELEKVAKD
jgi:hypothetical protein